MNNKKGGADFSAPPSNDFEELSRGDLSHARRAGEWQPLPLAVTDHPDEREGPEDRRRLRHGGKYHFAVVARREEPVPRKPLPLPL